MNEHKRKLEHERENKLIKFAGAKSESESMMATTLKRFCDLRVDSTCHGF